MIGLLGIDIGTTGTKTVLYSEQGEAIAEAYEESKLYYPGPGMVEQDPNEIYTSALNTAKAVVNTAKKIGIKIAAVAVDGQMAGLMGVDEQYRPVTWYDSWLDMRCARYVDSIWKSCGQDIMESCGLPPMAAHTSKILWWRENEPEKYKSIARFIMPAQYVSGKICGINAEKAFIDETYAHFTGLYDFKNACWNENICTKLNIDIEKLPNMVKPWSIIGEVTKVAEKESGIPMGTPVVAGCGDQAAGFLGAGITKPGMMVDVAGTASVFGFVVDKFKPDTDNFTIMQSRSVLDNLWVPHAYMQGGGLCLRWFRDNIVKNSGLNYKELDEKAERLPEGPTGILFQPYLGGCNFPCWPDMKGSFIGIDWNTNYISLYKAIMEGIAYQYKHYLSIEKEIFPEQSEKFIVSYGGGAKSQVFTQIKSDILGLPIVRLKRKEVATLGSAIIAGYAIGVFDDMAEAADNFTEYEKPVEPDQTRHEQYVSYALAVMRNIEELNNLYTWMGGREVV